jgi:hypothetical protein
MTSMAMSALSKIDHPSTKADCSSDTHFPRHSFNLLASNLDTILYKTLQRAMGLISFMEIGFSHLGIKQIFVSFKEEGK